MSPARRIPALLAVLSPLVVWSCTDAAPVGPEPDDSLAPLTVGGSNVVLDQVPGFFFLPPLSDGSPTIDREFNPGLSPELRICELGPDPEAGTGCLSDPVTVFAPGEATVSISDERYDWSWDTGARPTANFFGGKGTDNYFELQVAIGNVVLGSLILDPQKPKGPGQSAYPELVYAFRVGETIPVKVFIATDFLCDTNDPAVLECVTSQVVGDNGGLFFLDGSGITDPGTLSTTTTPPLLSIRIQPNSIPQGSVSTEFLLTLERLAVDVVDEGCGQSLDVLRIGDQCFRVTKSLEADLVHDATISICLDPAFLAFEDGTPLSEGQKRALEMVRWDAEEGVYEVIPGTENDDCGAAVAASLAAMQSVALAGSMMSFGLDDDSSDDGPSREVGIRLGGLSSSFSNFSYLLRGGVLDVNGVDGSTISAGSPGDDPEIAVPLRVVNRVLIEGEVVDVPVPGATLRAETADGSVDFAEVTTDADGNASLTWTVDDTELGEKDLVISSFGVTIDDLPAPGLVELSRDTISVRVLGEPVGFGTVTPDPPTLPDGTVLQEAGDVTVTVVDAADQSIPGATVNWSGDGQVQRCVTEEEVETCTTVTSSTTGADGTTTVTWTYGATVGPQTMTASLPGIEATAPFAGSAAAASTSCHDGFGTAKIDGVATGAEWACADSVPGIQVNLGGGATSAVLKTMNDGTNAYFLLRVQQGTGAEIFGLRFDFDSDGSDAASEHDDVIGYDAASRSSYDGYLSAQCVNGSQSKCFARDAVEQVAGAAANADGWTTYEMSHPLNSGDRFDFDAITNSPIGFFFTLTNGGGAKGNSQYPGFRDYGLLFEYTPPRGN